MIYLECKQKIISATTISVSGNTISDSGNGLADFNVGDKILIFGSLNASNDVQRKLTSVSAGSIVVDGSALTTESAGLNIVIEKIEFFSDKGEYHVDDRGATQYYSGSVLLLEEISWTSEDSWSKLNNISVSINRQDLLGEDNKTVFELQDKTKLFKFLIKLTNDDTILINNAVGIIRGLSEMSASFQLKNEVPDVDFLEVSPDINETVVYEQGRYYPKVYGSVFHFKPLLVNNNTYKYYSGSLTVETVYDDGVVVPFNGFLTSTYTIGNAVQYNNFAYTALVNNPTASPTGGATSNASWTYTGVAVSEAQFKGFAETFTLLSAPSGLVTIDSEGTNGLLYGVCSDLSSLIKVPNQTVISNGISASGFVLSDSNSLLGTFTPTSTGIIGQKIEIVGGLNDGIITTVTASGASSLTVSDVLTTESAGTTIKIIGYYGMSTANSDTSVGINYDFSRQQKSIEILKQICNFHEHIFYFDDVQKIMFLIDKEQSSNTLVIDELNISLDRGVTYLTKEIVFNFQSNWVEKVPSINPTELLELPRFTQVLTGVETGTTKNITQFENSNARLVLALEKKKDLYLNYDRIELRYTIDEKGLDPNLIAGVEIDFSSWISGDLFVQEVIKDISTGQNIARGLAKNIVFSG